MARTLLTQYHLQECCQSESFQPNFLPDVENAVPPHLLFEFGIFSAWEETELTKPERDST